jgi:hypothetical protein
MLRRLVAPSCSATASAAANRDGNFAKSTQGLLTGMLLSISTARHATARKWPVTAPNLSMAVTQHGSLFMMRQHTRAGVASCALLFLVVACPGWQTSQQRQSGGDGSSASKHAHLGWHVPVEGALLHHSGPCFAESVRKLHDKPSKKWSTGRSAWRAGVPEFDWQHRPRLATGRHAAVAADHGRCSEMGQSRLAPLHAGCCGADSLSARQFCACVSQDPLPQLLLGPLLGILFG